MPRAHPLVPSAEVEAFFDTADARRTGMADPVYVPEYDAALTVLVNAFWPYVPAEARILDVGAGAGYLSRRVLDCLPQAQVTLLDFSANMLSAADQVLSPYPGQYETLRADYNHADLPAGAFDAVVSSFAIHYTRGDGAYRSLYRRLHRALVPGGVFACCDMVAGATDEWSQLGEQGWRAHLEEVLAPDAVEHTLETHYAQDTPLSVQGHFTCLRQAGFGVVDLLWKRDIFAVYVARK
jgi:tRNA (cmo5U34)-methyltransferase